MGGHLHKVANSSGLLHKWVTEPEKAFLNAVLFIFCLKPQRTELLVIGSYNNLEVLYQCSSNYVPGAKIEPPKWSQFNVQ